MTSPTLINRAPYEAYAIGLLLSFIGGFCDGTTFFLMDIFCGHVTGNTVLSVVAFFRGEWLIFFQTILTLCALALGMGAGALWIKYITGSRSAFRCVLVVTALLLLSFGLSFIPVPKAVEYTLCAAVCAFSLGILNELAKIRLGSAFAVSYITGSTVSFIGKNVLRENSAASSRIPYGLNLLGFFSGAVAGVGLSKLFDLYSLLFLGIPLFIILVLFWRLER